MTVHISHASLFSAAHTASGDLYFTPTPDGLLGVQGSQFIVSRPMQLAAAWAAGEPLFPQGATSALTGARVESPTFADINPAAIRAIEGMTTGIATSALSATDMACEPLPLRAGDPLSLVANVLGGTTANIEMHALLWFTDGCDPIPDAPSLWAEFEIDTVPTTQGAWTSANISFRRPLPGRRFAIRGLDYVQQGAFAARLALPGSPLKPGAPALQSIAARRSRLLDSMHLGVLGVFDGFAPPTLEVFIPTSATAGTVARGWMRIAPLEVGARTSNKTQCGCGGSNAGSCGCRR